jgi:E3 ubiquitin-protein ligase HUWE1
LLEHRNLKWILENNIEEADLGLTFEADADNFGMVEAVELVPNGRDVPVTEDNKREYVRLVMELKLQKSIGKQMEALLDGFHQIVPPALLPVFNEYELGTLIFFFFQIINTNNTYFKYYYGPSLNICLYLSFLALG